jgi:PAS domain S-box-containing protein
MNRKIFSFGFISAILLSVVLVVLGGLNIQQKRKWVAPEDGCSWIQTDSGIEARQVVADGPCDRAGIRPGDLLKEINGRSVESDRHVTQLLYEIGVWQKADYAVVRNGWTSHSPLHTTVIVAAPPVRLLRQHLYLEIIGLLYFLIGIFVLIKRFQAPHALHFHLVCLVSFVFYVFHYTGQFNTFDWAIFWIGLVAQSLLPPLFLHFCFEFPEPQKWIAGRKRRLFYAALYAPGFALLLAWIAFVHGFLGSLSSPVLLRTVLETFGDVHFGAFFVLGAIVLLWTYRTAETSELRQQMKWVTRGTIMGALPYFMLQTVPRIAGGVPDTWVDFAVFPLVLIPTSFAYAIHRYRLMDVDILFKRGVTYTLATASVLGLSATLVVLLGDLLGSGLEPFGTIARILATIVAALLFAPIKDQFQVWLDKVFYRERYSIRQTLIDFGRTLGSEVRLEKMLDSIVDRLSRALSVDHAAVFLESPSRPERFTPALAVGCEIPQEADLSFLKISTDRPYFFFENEVHGLNYFIPCRVKDRVIAYIGLGRTKSGDYVTSEDLDLLQATSDYVGIALENARLYKSIEDRAAEYQDLKDFNENIIESINVGVLVEDVDGRIVGWNKALEDLTGRSRAETLGRRAADVIPSDFLLRLAEHRYLYKQKWNDVTINLSATSLLDKSGATRGTLIIIDNITDRIRLEDQLVQNDKLTSIGLLAAGVAHEVNTPLAVISSHAQMLRKQISSEDPRSKLLEKITKQTFRASEIVNNLLSFSRIHATEFNEIDVHQIINDTLALLEHQLKKARIHVDRQLLAEHSITMGNSGKLQQVFLNLFLNARDAMVDGGELHVRTVSAGSKIEIVVEDTGSGISPENIKKIYDPFFTTKTAGKGTGLGLSVSYGIVREHGGAISVESKLGRGTSFKLEFPMARKVVHV